MHRQLSIKLAVMGLTGPRYFNMRLRRPGAIEVVRQQQRRVRQSCGEFRLAAAAL
jgi:hypothetical protein